MNHLERRIQIKLKKIYLPLCSMYLGDDQLPKMKVELDDARHLA